MKKFVNKIIASLAGLAVATPIVCINTTSCVSKHVQITKIRLSSRYKYIYPGGELKIKAEVFPYGASKNDIDWKIESPILGFSISDIGKIHAPASFPPTEEPISINVIATSKTNPAVSTSYSIIATEDKEHELLGFAGDFKYMDRGGNTVTKKIKHMMSSGVRLYYLEGTDPTEDEPTPSHQKGVPLYAGRENEFFDFTPVFKTGKDRGMTFELSNVYDFNDQAISWVGYEDGTITPTIPKFLTLNPTIKGQSVYIYFTSEGLTTVFWLYCNIYQNTDLNTPAVFGYQPSGTDLSQDKHNVLFRSEGVYATQILCPLFKAEVPSAKEREIGDIYVYRKPYEELADTIEGVWEPKKDAPDIFTENGQPQFSKITFGGQHLPGHPDYQIGTFNATYTIDPLKLQDLDTENYQIGTYYCYDKLDPGHQYPVARLDFKVQWIEE